MEYMDTEPEYPSSGDNFTIPSITSTNTSLLWTMILPAGVIPNKSSSTSSAFSRTQHKHFITDIYFYSMAFVIPTGLLCNIFCLLIFSLSPGLRRSSTGHYLTALACADTTFLVGDLIRWMNLDTVDGSRGYYLKMNFMHTSQIACQMTYWLRYGGKLASAWITVVIVLERLLTVACPLKVSRISTARRAKIIISTVYASCFASGSYPFWTVGVAVSRSNRNVTKCIVTDLHAYPIYNTVVLWVGTLGLPFAIIFVVTLVIVGYLVHAMNYRRRAMGTDSAPSHHQFRQMPPPSRRSPSPISMASLGAHQSCCSHRSTGRNPPSRATSKPPERQLTITLLSVCMVFLFLRLPYTIAFGLYSSKSKSTDPDLTLKLFAAWRITDIIATFNYVVNFFLYCLCGSYFRLQISTVFGCKQRRDNQARLRRLTAAKELTQLSTTSGRFGQPPRTSNKPVESGKTTLFMKHL